jgi:hypothetical protein
MASGGESPLLVRLESSRVLRFRSANEFATVPASQGCRSVWNPVAENEQSSGRLAASSTQLSAKPHPMQNGMAQTLLIKIIIIYDFRKHQSVCA